MNELNEKKKKQRTKLHSTHLRKIWDRLSIMHTHEE